MSVDTLSNIATSIAGMSSLDYAFLLFKMGGVVIGALGSLVALSLAAIKAITAVWSVILERIRHDLSTSFCTPDQLKQAMDAVTARLSSGDDRMERIEEKADETKEALDLLSTRLNRVLMLMAAGGAGNPTLPAAAARTAMESDDSIFHIGDHLPGHASHGGHA